VLPELRTYNCKQCRVTVNGSGETERAARCSEGAPLLLDHGPKGGDNLWLQMAALVIVTLVVIALAAEYVW
jgi:hypothetical protein